MTGEEPAGYLLDASALLALLHREPGWDAVAAVLLDSAVSAVNWAEVLQKAGERGVDLATLRQSFGGLGVEILAFDEAQAAAAAGLWRVGRSLSLGDRACLGTALTTGRVAVTADRAWADIDLPVGIKVIR